MQPSVSHKRWLPLTITVVIFAVLLIFHGSPRTAHIESSAGAQPPSAEPPGWPMLGGSPARNMVNTKAKNLPVKWDDEQGNLIKAKVLWSADLGSRAHGGPIIAGGKIFVGTNNQNPRNLKDRDAQGDPIDLGVLMVFNQADGKFLYQTVFPKLKTGRVNDWPLEGLRCSPTVDGDRMYYINNRSDVVCSDLDGKIIWKFDMIGNLGVFPHMHWAGNPPSSVLVLGDDLFLVTNNGVDGGHLIVPSPAAPSFLKLSKKDGTVLWQDNSPTAMFPMAKNGAEQQKQIKRLVNQGKLIQHNQYSNPAHAVVGGKPQIVFPGGDGWIYSFTPVGKLIWKFDCNPKDAKYELGSKGTRSDFMATPVIYKDRVYIGLGQDGEHGAGVGHLWCIDMNKKGDVSPELVVNGNVWPPVTRPNPNSATVWHYGGFVAKGMRRWQFGRTMSTCAIHEDLLYIAELDGNLHCLDALTGKLQWQHDMESDTWSSPFLADGKIYMGADDGRVYVFSHGKEKKLLAENDMTQPVRATPVAVGDVLYVIAGNKLYALKN